MGEHPHYLPPEDGANSVAGLDGICGGELKRDDKIETRNSSLWFKMVFSTMESTTPQYQLQILANPSHCEALVESKPDRFHRATNDLSSPCSEV